MTTQVVCSQEFSKHNNPGHPENARRLEVMMEEVQQSPLVKELEFVEPEILPEKTLYEIHSEDMIEQIKEFSSIGDSWIDLDTYVCTSDYETARLAAGGLVKIVNDVRKGKADNGFALVRPPGHHATSERSMGFCLFNNAALAANELAKHGKKVLIFDCDVHHGNGTQDIFYQRNDVLYQSIHLSPHYPGTGDVSESGTGDGKGYTVNAPLMHGNGDVAVSEVLDTIFLPIARQFSPDVIIVSSGFDSHYSDRLGGLMLTANFFGEMIAKYQAIQPKLVCTLEGGYSLGWIGKCLCSQLGQLVDHPVSFSDSARETSTVGPLLAELKNELGRVWTFLN